MHALVAVCIAAVGISTLVYLSIRSLRTRPEGKLDTIVALALKYAKPPESDRLKPLPLQRAQFLKSSLRFHGRLPRMASVRDTTVPTGGFDIPVRVYRPIERTDLQLVLYLHGGGFVKGSIETHENICRHIAKESGSIVLSPDYRLAPEHPFPTPLEDCYTVLQWISRNALSLGGRADDISVAGDSAGGTIAAALCLMARDRGGPQISHQVLIYPATDFSHLDTASYKMFGSGYMLDSDEVAWSLAQYLPNKLDYSNPYASPLLAQNLHSLPDALIITAEFDVLRDEGQAYADKLRQSGVPVLHSCTKGVTHAYLSGTRVLKRKTGRDFRRIARFLRGEPGARQQGSPPTMEG